MKNNSKQIVTTRNLLLILIAVVVGLGAWCLSKKDLQDTTPEKQEITGRYSAHGEFVGFYDTTFKGIDCTSTGSSETKWFDLIDVDTSLAVPCGYDLVLPAPASWGEHGSFRNYRFWPRRGTSVPHLQTIFFLTGDTAPETEPDCTGGCTPTVTQKEFVAAQRLWNNAAADKQQLGEAEYVISDEFELGDERYRQYRTFLGDMMVDIRVMLKETNTTESADQIVSQLKYKEY